MSKATKHLFKHLLLQEEFPTAIELSIQVLSTRDWPLSVAGAHKISLPIVAFDSFRSFSYFYSPQHTGKILTLMPALGTAEIDAVFYGADEPEKKKLRRTSSQTSAGTYSLVVSTYQMCVLMLFNEKEKLSYEASLFIKFILINCYNFSFF